MLFVDRGPFGRVPSLQPVTWVDGWPMAGVDGKAVTTYKKPDVGRTYPIMELPTSDEFDSTGLGMQWGWNHNPEPSKWSLTERPGYLRLSTVKVSGDLTMARNTLTQRPLIKYDLAQPTIGTTRLDVAHMEDGDEAGLAVFQNPYGYIAVRRKGRARYIVMVNNGKTVDSVSFKGTTVYLRAIGLNATSKATFEYSLDNKTFTSLGDALEMRFSLTIFTGNKYCLFNYATKRTGGYVDFDYLRME
jgi:beta-xylosidase